MSVPGKQVRNGVYEFADYSRIPIKLSRWDAVCLTVYNPSTGQVFGRTRSSWGTVGLFYLVFFSVLALLFAICMKGLLATVNEDRPKWILDSSLIGTNPGLGFRPISENTEEGSLIWYNASNATDLRMWTNRVDQFLEFYKNSSLLPTGGRNQQICSFEQPAKDGNVCAVEVNNWGPCSPAQSYGFNNSAPCVFIKLNRIYGWVPEFYNNTKDLPSDMPKSLVDHIKMSNPSTLNTVWVSCRGEDPADRETIGEIEYFPNTWGFPGFYYPYTNTPGYLSPLVAVRFSRPKRNVLINVECRAWARNIHYSGQRNQRQGSVHFEFMIDD